MLLTIAALQLSACGAPGLNVRDNYMGRAWLEPRLTIEPIERDAIGNTIPPPARRQRGEFPVYRSD